MPNSVQTFNINASGNTSPTGNGAQMSRTGSNNQPNQGQWRTASESATVKLPSAVWNVTADPGKTTYSFSIDANSTSATYTLLTTAATGTQSYEVETAPGLGGGKTEPSVVVNP